MPRGNYGGVEVNPNPTVLPTITLAASEAALWPVASWSPIPANSQSPTAYELYACGTMTTTATASPTITFAPRIGTTTSGAALGASASIALTASVTAFLWEILGRVTVRNAGSGTAANAYGFFHYRAKQATAGAGAVDAHHVFGGTVATFDSTAAQGLFIGVSSAVTTTTVIPQQIHWESKN